MEHHGCYGFLVYIPHPRVIKGHFFTLLIKELKISEDHRAGNHGAGRRAFPGHPGVAWPRPTLVPHAPEARGQSVSAAIPRRQQHQGTTAAQSPPAPTATAPPALPAPIKPFQHHCFVSTISHVQRFLQPHLQRPMTNESTSYTIAAHSSGQIFAT